MCPLSIFSNTSLNLLASLGCCINPPPSLPRQPPSTPTPPQFNTLQIYKFLMSALSKTLRQRRPQTRARTQSPYVNFSAAIVTSACRRATFSASSAGAEAGFDAFGVITHILSFTHCGSIVHALPFTGAPFTCYYAPALIMSVRR